MGDGVLGTEESGAVTDLFFSFDEQLVKRLRRGGVAKGDVDGEVGADVVVCAKGKWSGVVLRLDQVCWL